MLKKQNAQDWSEDAFYIEPGSPWENGYYEGLLAENCAMSCSMGRSIFYNPEGSHRYRALAQALQHDQTALIAELSTTGSADISASNPSGSERGNTVVSIPLVQKDFVRSR